MKLTEIELKGYKRLALSNIRSIKIDLTNPYQVIIGTNGSGKSSLLKELTVLPANSSDYDKGGFKRVVAEFNNKKYVLISNFTGKAHHSFMVEGVEKNEGGTITVQRELVQQTFGITDEIHKLMTGTTRITRMTAGKRRELFTKMSDSDMTYAFSVYNKVKALTRDDQGVIKHLKGRVTKETERLVSIKDETEGLEVEVTQLQNEITALMENRRKDLPRSDDVMSRLSNHYKQLNEISEFLIANKLDQPTGFHFKTLEDVSGAIGTVEGGIELTRQTLEQYTEEYDRLSRYLNDVKENGVGDITGLENKLNELKDRLQSIPASEQFNVSGDYSDFLSQAQRFKSQLVDNLSLLVDNSDLRLSRKTHDEVKAKIGEYEALHSKFSAEKHWAEEKIHHIKNAKETACPSCGYVWKDGVSENDLKVQEERLAIAIDKLNTVEERSTKAKAQMEEMLEYFNQYNRTAQLAYSFPQAQPLFDWLLEDNRLAHQPTQYIPVVERFLTEIDNATKRYKLSGEIERLEETLNNAKAADVNGIQHMGESFASIEKKVAEQTQRLNDLTKRKGQLKTYHSDVVKREEMVDRFHDVLHSIEKDKGIYVDSLRSEFIGDLLNKHQTTLAIKTQRANERKTLSDTVSDLNNSLGEVTQSHEIHKTLTKALSPVEGLIARQMTMFINVVIGQVNEILENLYTYPIEIQPCGFDGADLDYKFPLRIGHANTGGDDISEGSEGQMEVIDFAFRLVALMYLGFSDYPLYIDEVGQNQDETHLPNVMNYIKLLIESHRHSQLFLISHFAVGFGAFNQADICVLNSSNITVPMKHNEHVEIEG